LTCGDRLQSTANNLGNVCGDDRDYRNLRPHQFVHRQPLRHEERKHHGGHEQKRDQRNAAHELDVGDTQASDRRQFRPPPKRERNGERKSHGESDRGQEEGQRQSTPEFGRDIGESEHTAAQQRDGRRGQNHPQEE
jgi:hypothetical protein